MRNVNIKLILVTMICLFGIIQMVPELNGPDAGNYMAIAKSLSFKNSLMLHDELKKEECPLTIVPETGYPVEWHQIGVSLIWAFVFKITKFFGLEGESLLIVVVKLIEHCLGICALFLIFLTVKRFVSVRSALWGIIAVLFGTNFFAYMTLLGGSAHAASVFFAALFLWFYLKSYPERGIFDWVLLGGIGGFMLLMRGETGLYFILPALDLFELIRKNKIREFFSRILSFCIGVLVIFSPQLVYWKIVFGTFIRPYAEADFFSGNKYIEVLFSCSRGLVFFSPLLFICFVLGAVGLYRIHKRFALASFFVFTGLLFTIGRAKYGWWQGASFGGRYFLSLVPLFTLCVCVCFTRLRDRLVSLITIISAGWSFFLLTLFVTQRELDAYSTILQVVNKDLLFAIKDTIREYIKLGLFDWVFFKAIAVLVVIFLIWLGFNQAKRLNSSLIKNYIAVFCVCFVIFVDFFLIRCVVGDQVIIAQLRSKGFYKNAVFGHYDKADIAEAYREYTVEAIRDGRKEEAVLMLLRAARLYPPLKEEQFVSLYDVYLDHPDLDFRKAFLKYADAQECLLLSKVFADKGDKENAEFFRKKAGGD